MPARPPEAAAAAAAAAAAVVEREPPPAAPVPPSPDFSSCRFLAGRVADDVGEDAMDRVAGACVPAQGSASVRCLGAELGALDAHVGIVDQPYIFFGS